MKSAALGGVLTLFFAFGGKKISLKPEKDPDRQFHIYFMLTKTNYHFVASFSLSLCSISQGVLPRPAAV